MEKSGVFKCVGVQDRALKLCPGMKPHLKGGLGGEAPSLGNFCGYIANVPHPKPRIPKASL